MIFRLPQLGQTRPLTHRTSHLENLDWSEWNEFEVHLIVCRPVQKEIDNLKNSRNGRVSKRAHATSGLFRETISSKSEYKLVQKAGPQVKLYLQGPSLPSKKLKDVLDYNKTDDEIIGYLHEYMQENPDADAKLLTHDTGPMATAKYLGIPFIRIRDEWIRPPENNESEKEIARLKNQVELLKRSEPQFKLKFVGARGSKLDSIKYAKFEPLTSDEIDSYILSLKERFPPAQYFGSQESTEEQPTEIAFDVMKGVVFPVLNKDVHDYEKQYRDWLKDCEDRLSPLHKVLQIVAGRPGFIISVENVGSRPGMDSLIEIEAKGNFTILPSGGDENSADQVKQHLKLPLPPSPPQSILEAHLSLDTSLANTFPDIENLLSRLTHDSHRDPDEFYFKPDRPDAPTKSFRLECKRWRHGVGATSTQK